MNLIVAVDANWGIGCQDRLLFRIREDMKRFRALTIGKTVILGRKTLMTFPGGRPLEKRANLVLSSQSTFAADPAVICHSLDELSRKLTGVPDEDIFVIGGASVYELLLPYCETAYVTRVDRAFPADRHFPDLDSLPDWQLVSCENFVAQDALVDGYSSSVELEYAFCTYRQNTLRSLRDEP